MKSNTHQYEVRIYDPQIKEVVFHLVLICSKDQF